MIASARRIASLPLAVTGLIAFGAAAAGAADAPPKNLELIESQIEQIERHDAAERNRVDSDELVIINLIGIAHASPLGGAAVRIARYPWLNGSNSSFDFGGWRGSGWDRVHCW